MQFYEGHQGCMHLKLIHW